MATGAKMNGAAFNAYPNVNNGSSGKFDSMSSKQEKHEGGARDVDVTPDMHLKMSKKIAQLTKVRTCVTHGMNKSFDSHHLLRFNGYLWNEVVDLLYWLVTYAI